MDDSPIDDPSGDLTRLSRDVQRIMRCVRPSSFGTGRVDETVLTRCQDSGPGEIDLHGLYVKEAIDYTDRAIEAAKRRGDTTLNIIVGSSFCFAKRREVSSMTTDFACRQGFAFQWRGS